jgi:predicted GNAT family acetyltransferase
VSLLVNDILARGFTPFLHVSEQNVRAIAIYERLGFTTRARIELWLLRKP